MGAIQSSINQAINLGTALYTQTGAYERKKEAASLKKERKELTEGRKEVAKAFSSDSEKLAKGRSPEEREVYYEKLQEIDKRLGDINIKLGEGAKSAESYALVAMSKRALANQKAKAEQATKAFQKQQSDARIQSAKKLQMSILKEDK